MFANSKITIASWLIPLITMCMISADTTGEGNPKKRKPKGNNKKRKKVKNDNLKGFGPKFDMSDKVELPDVPKMMTSDKFVTHILSVSRKVIIPLLQSIFPDYKDIESEAEVLLEKLNQDYQKVTNDEAMRSRLTYLAQAQQRMMRVEQLITKLACEKLRIELNKSVTTPTFFKIQVEEEDNMPDFNQYPDLKEFIDNLGTYLAYHFKKIYNDQIIDQGKPE